MVQTLEQTSNRRVNAPTDSNGLEMTEKRIQMTMVYRSDHRVYQYDFIGWKFLQVRVLESTQTYAYRSDDPTGTKRVET